MSAQQEIINKWEEVLQLCEKLLNEGKFTFHSNSGRVEISFREDPKGTIIRGEGILYDCRAQELLSLFQDDEIIKYDKATKSITMIDLFERNGKEFKIKQYILNSPAFLIAERDFIYVEHVKTQGNVTILLTTSIDGLFPIEKIPQIEGTVRGTNYFNFLKLTQLENGNLEYITLSQGNPNGYIPLALSNAFVYERPKQMVTLGEEVLKKKCELK